VLKKTNTLHICVAV